MIERGGKMGVSILDPNEYGRLCGEIVPKAIETEEEFDRLVAQMEALDFKENPTPEEEALSATLAVLTQDYDDKHYPLPKTSPDHMIRFLMEHGGLKQTDLLPIFGTRSVASDVINGKREPSKAHVRKLAEFFRLPADLFL
jgi:HTH-type transcriptional regulator/antitoxin HigA